MVPSAKGALLILWTYLDDGGAEDQKVMVISGLLASFPRWSSIESRWLAAETTHGIGGFHARAMRRPGGPCESWSKERYLDLLRELADIVIDARPIHLGFGTSISDFNTAVARFPHLGTLTSSPFDFCMNFVLQQLASAMNQHFPGERLAIVFDLPRSDLRAAADRCLDAHQKSFWSKYLDSVVFQNSRSCAPLRVADFVANDTFRYFRDCVVGDRSRRPPVFTERAIGKIESFAKYYTPDAWDTLIQMMKDGVQVSEIPVP